VETRPRGGCPGPRRRRTVRRRSEVGCRNFQKARLRPSRSPRTAAMFLPRRGRPQEGRFRIGRGMGPREVGLAAPVSRKISHAGALRPSPPPSSHGLRGSTPAPPRRRRPEDTTSLETGGSSQGRVEGQRQRPAGSADGGSGRRGTGGRPAAPAAEGAAVRCAHRRVPTRRPSRNRAPIDGQGISLRRSRADPRAHEEGTGRIPGDLTEAERVARFPATRRTTADASR